MLRDHFEKKNELLQAALIEFAKNGYEQASINRILSRAKMSKGAFYYHFLNKESLFAFLVDTVVEEKIRFLKEKTVHHLTENKDIFFILEEHIRYAYEFGRLHPLYTEFAQSLLKEKNRGKLSEMAKNAEQQSETFFRSFIHSGYEAGFYDQRFSEEFLVRLITFLFSHAYDFLTFSFEADPEGWGENLKTLILFLRKGFGTSLPEERRTPFDPKSDSDTDSV